MTRPLLDDLAVRATQRRAMLHVLALPCARHAAAAGKPCWTIPRDTPGTESIGLCGERIAKAHTRRQR